MSSEKKEEQNVEAENLKAGRESFSSPVSTWAKDALARSAPVAGTLSALTEQQQQNLVDKGKDLGRRTDNTLCSLVAMVKNLSSIPADVVAGLKASQERVATLSQGRVIQHGESVSNPSNRP